MKVILCMKTFFFYNIHPKTPRCVGVHRSLYFKFTLFYLKPKHKIISYNIILKFRRPFKRL